jgi:hypothetical protein
MTIQALYPLTQPSLNLDFANTKKLDPRITFARASSARYYDGKTTAKAEENLLLQSQDITTTWTNVGTTDIANTTTAPDGTTTADTMTETTGSGTHDIRQTGVNVISGLRYVWSIFAKKGDGATAPDIIQLTWGTGGFDGSIFANYDISVGGGTSGTVTTTGAGAVSASITAVGNGWYRCVLIADATATTTSGISVLFTNNNPTATRGQSYVGAVTANVFLWGAQLEQRSSVTAYTVTTTQAITNYSPTLQTALDNVARFDHNPVTGESLGLFVEEQRTNLLLRSEEFSNASWTKTASSITANIIVAPDGTLTADKVVEDTTASTTHLVISTATAVTTGTVYTGSVYLKAAERGFALVVFGVGASQAIPGPAGVSVNLSSGAVAAVVGSVTSFTSTPVGNGWYRVTVTASATSTASTNFSVYLSTDGVWANRSFTGDGYSGLYLWGAQLEAGAFATSYIPTVASQVTRSADAASMTGANFSSWYNQAEGTVYSEFRPIGITTANRLFSIDDGTSSIQSRALTSATWEINASTTPTVSIFDLYTSGVLNKMALGMKFNDYGCVFNATPEVADTSAGVLVGANRLSIGCHLASAGQLNGHIKKLSYYPLRLPAAQLQALTA